MQQNGCCLENDNTSRVEAPAQVWTDNVRPTVRLVVTSQNVSASAEAVWDALMFYEDIAKPAPFFLRRIVPRAIGSEGCKSEVGNEVKCRYVSGHLLKRVTRLVHGQSYAFDVVEQNLPLHGGIRVLGGEYVLHQLSAQRTRVALSTRYESPTRPRWLCGWLETAVCHAFHRHILAAMQTTLIRSVVRNGR